MSIALLRRPSSPAITTVGAAFETAFATFSSSLAGLTPPPTEPPTVPPILARASAPETPPRSAWILTSSLKLSIWFWSEDAWRLALCMAASACMICPWTRAISCCFFADSSSLDSLAAFSAWAFSVASFFSRFSISLAALALIALTASSCLFRRSRFSAAPKWAGISVISRILSRQAFACSNCDFVSEMLFNWSFSAFFCSAVFPAYPAAAPASAAMFLALTPIIVKSPSASPAAAPIEAP